ncbi:BspA family leucine-rich repeat surface protein, partial [Enterococcus sp. C1]|uniref:BspA family leucine-rich repeat surface protein n=1 Tax=Enterococcus sp. C1 TaxID=1182762 RepID=UPI00178C8204
MINKELIKKIRFTGPVKLGRSASYFFARLRNLTTIEGLRMLDTSNVEDMRAFFYDTPSLKEIEPIDLAFNTTNVRTMDYMFQKTNIPKLDIRYLSTSSVTSMGSMFAMSNISELKLGDFKTSKVTDM